MFISQHFSMGAIWTFGPLGALAAPGQVNELRYKDLLGLYGLLPAKSAKNTQKTRFGSANHQTIYLKVYYLKKNTSQETNHSATTILSSFIWKVIFPLPGFLNSIPEKKVWTLFRFQIKHLKKHQDSKNSWFIEKLFSQEWAGLSLMF